MHILVWHGYRWIWCQVPISFCRPTKSCVSLMTDLFLHHDRFECVPKPYWSTGLGTPPDVGPVLLAADLGALYGC